MPTLFTNVDKDPIEEKSVFNERKNIDKSQSPLLKGQCCQIKILALLLGILKGDLSSLNLFFSHFLYGKVKKRN